MFILVLGGTGFVGAKVVNKLVSKNVKVKVLTRAQSSIIKSTNGVEYCFGDLLDRDLSITEILSNCFAVVNCAGEVVNEELMFSLHGDAIERWVTAAKSVARLRGASIHWVQLSSVGVYGPPDYPDLIRAVSEDYQLKPASVYEESKALSDLVIQAAISDDFFSFSIVRPSNIFGLDMPNDSLRNLAETIRKKRFFWIGKPGAISTYVHVDDVSFVLCECIFNPHAKNEIFNLSTDCYQVELIDSIARCLNVSILKIRVPYLLVKILVYLFSWIPVFPLSIGRLNSLVCRTSYPIDKIKHKLNFAPIKYPPKFIAEVIRS